MAGPALGGVLFGLAASLPFFLDGASFALSALLLTLAVPRRAAPPAATTRVRDDVREGWRAFTGDPRLWGLAVVIALLAFSQALVLGVLVLYATETLGLSDTTYGVLLAGAAVAHVAGGLLGSKADRALGSARAIVVGALLAGVGYFAMGVAGSLLVAAAGLVIEAVAVAVANVASLTLRQRLIPAGLLGRVGNIFRFFIFGTVPVGALLGGILASSAGLRAPMLVAAALAVSTGIGTGLVLTRGRREVAAPVRR
jgi:predicted MFS family arabinose efflux permease